MCAEKQRLVELYETATNEFSRTVGVLSTRIGVLSRVEYAAVLDASERARQASDKARDDLARHVDEHGC